MDGIPVDAPKFGDAEVAVTVKTLKERPEARFGLVLDDSDPLNGEYIFRVTTEGSFNFVLAKPLENVLLEGSSPTINRGNGSVNDLRVRIQGPRLEFFVNETKVGETDLETSFSGSVDLFSYGGGEFVFSDLVVEPI